MIPRIFGALLSLGLLQAQGAHAIALPRTVTAGADAVSTQYRFPNGTWLENIALRANGDVLTTVATAPELYLLPAGQATARLVHRFSEATSLFGIAEVCPDEFVVSVGNFSFSTGADLGSFAMWSVRFGGGGSSGGQGSTQARVRKIADLGGRLFPNGVATLNAGAGLVLLSDSTNGRISAFDVATGAHRVVLDHPSMKIEPGAALQFGSNGVRVRAAPDGRTWVYYVNMSQDKWVRVPVDPMTGEAVGEYRVSSLPEGTAPDDFDVAADGTLYVVGNPTNELLRVDGEVEKILGGPKRRVLMGPTSAALGRLPGDEDTLYVSTSGGMVSPDSGPYHGGEVVKIKVNLL